MQRRACSELLDWALPRLALRGPGFRGVRGQVCKRIARRAAALGLRDAGEYRALLESSPDEWRVLDTLCRVTISRFYRDRGSFDLLAHAVLPAFAEAALRAGAPRVRALCLGCAGGEEAYTLAIVWRHCAQHRAPGVALQIVAIDADPHQIERARLGSYPGGALAELPTSLREAAFEPCGDRWRVRDEYRSGIELRCDDVRKALPDGPFQLVLCRNLAFTYFDEATRDRVLAAINARLSDDGVLVLGKREALPDLAGFVELEPGSRVYRR